MNPIEFADKFITIYKHIGDEISARFCPICGGGANKDQYTFSINNSNLTYNCLRGSCGASGRFEELCLKYGVVADSSMNRKRHINEIDTTEKVYTKPKDKLLNLSDTATKYLNLRGFSESTIVDLGLSEVDGNLAFPYYEDGELVMVKYRPPRKVDKGERKMWRSKGGKPVFWGIDDIGSGDAIVICEGEFDRMAIYEAGYHNVISLPSGTNDLTCIELCWDLLDSFKKIIIWTDNDEPGIKCRKELIRRFGDWRCWYVEMNGESKDANELLYVHGKEAVLEFIKNAKEIPISGIVNLSTVQRMDYSSIPKVSTGFQAIDKVIGGLMMGQISIFTGVNSSGKSTFISNLLLNVLDAGEKVCAYSGELPSSMFKYWANLQASGLNHLVMKFNDIKQSDYATFDPNVLSLIEAWYNNKYFIFEAEDGVAEYDDLLRKFEYAYRKYGVKVFMVDNLMTTDYGDLDRDFYRSQSKFIRMVKNFAKKYGVHVIMVAHPRKVFDRVGKMDVSGTGDITNLADLVFSIHRVSEVEKLGKYTGVDNVVELFKNRINGVQDVEFWFNFEQHSKRFYELNHEEDQLHREYGWVKFARELYL